MCRSLCFSTAGDGAVTVGMVVVISECAYGAFVWHCLCVGERLRGGPP